jgi:hypothetical protein
MFYKLYFDLCLLVLYIHCCCREIPTVHANSALSSFDIYRECIMECLVIVHFPFGTGTSNVACVLLDRIQLGTSYWCPFSSSPQSNRRAFNTKKHWWFFLRGLCRALTRNGLCGYVLLLLSIKKDLHDVYIYELPPAAAFGIIVPKLYCGGCPCVVAFVELCSLWNPNYSD